MFSGNSILPSDLLGLDIPVEFFLYSFPKDMIHLIVEQTNLCMVQKKISTNPYKLLKLIFSHLYVVDKSFEKIRKDNKEEY